METEKTKQALVPWIGARAIRAVGNAFLVLFCIDGCLSLLGVFLAEGLDVPPTVPLAGLVGITLLITSSLCFMLMGTTTRLPKRVFLPMILFLFWRMAAGMPLPLWLGWAATLWLMPLIQILSGLLGLAAVRRGAKGKGWPLARADFEDAGFSMANSLGYSAATLFFIIPGSLLYLVFSVHLAFDHYTAGFFHIDGQGIHTEERIYERGEKAVHLIGMMHIGESDFYRDLVESFSRLDSIVLLEGVTDEEDLISDDFSYSGIAAAIGLDTQSLQEGSEAYRGRHADVDASAFSAGTINLINTTAALFATDTLAKRIEASRMQGLAVYSTEHIHAIVQDLLLMRNEHLLDELEEALDQYDRVVIPWGAAHMPGLEEGILDLGFEHKHSRRHNVVRFGN